MGKTERIAYLDVSRIIVAFLVIFGHLYTYSDDNDVRIFIYEFHLPFFFLVSGMLHKQSEPMPSIKKYTRLLLVPVLSFCALFFIFSSITYYLGWDNFKSSWSSMLNHASYCSLVISYLKVTFVNFAFGEGMVNGPCWFLIALFYCKVLTDIVIGDKYKWAYIVVAILFYLCCIRYNRYFWLANGLMAIPFFLCGYYLKDKINIIVKKVNPIVGFIFCFLFTVVLMKINGPVSMWTIRWGAYSWYVSMPLFYITGTIGSFMILYLSSMFRKNNRYTLLAGNSLLVILCTQIFFVYISDTVLGYNLNYFVSFVISTIIMILCIGLNKMINVKFPFLLGKF
ncbi:acyltransferase family protein [Prevotella sp. RM4]|uniref:acyltransferase family protein n=1 Tax=Prevotella sp. RM4 TaxID=1200547 RepID=UPI00051AB0EF